MILLHCCCGKPLPQEPIVCVFNYPAVMTNLIWAFVVLVVFLVLGIKVLGFLKERCNMKQKEAELSRKHEIDLKESVFEHEKDWHEKGQEDKVKALDLRIREFEELTLHQKLLEKVIEKSTDEKVSDMKKEFEELKGKFEFLNGEIEQIIIKKKQ